MAANQMRLKVTRDVSKFRPIWENWNRVHPFWTQKGSKIVILSKDPSSIDADLGSKIFKILFFENEAQVLKWAEYKIKDWVTFEYWPSLQPLSATFNNVQNPHLVIDPEKIKV